VEVESSHQKLHFEEPRGFWKMDLSVKVEEFAEPVEGAELAEHVEHVGSVEPEGLTRAMKTEGWLAARRGGKVNMDVVSELDETHHVFPEEKRDYRAMFDAAADQSFSLGEESGITDGHFQQRWLQTEFQHQAEKAKDSMMELDLSAIEQASQREDDDADDEEGAGVIEDDREGAGVIEDDGEERKIAHDPDSDSHLTLPFRMSFPAPKLQHYTGTPSEDVNAWVDQVSSLLAADNSLDSEEKKFKAAIPWIGGEARYFANAYNGDKKWSDFSKALIAAKDPGGSLKASGELFRLRQTGALQEYYAECLRVFGRILEPAPMSQAEQARAFLRGLAPPYDSYAVEVIKAAAGLNEAYALLVAKVPEPRPRLAVVEADLDAVGPFRGREARPIRSSRYTSRPGRQPLMSLEEARKKGVCRWCERRWQENHNCPSSVFISLGVLGGYKSLLIIEASIEGQNIQCLVDSGASHNFISARYVPQSILPSRTGTVSLADGSRRACTGPVYLAVRVQGQLTSVPFLVMETKFEAILGLQWLSLTQPFIDWGRRSLTVRARHAEPGKVAASEVLNTVEMEAVLSALNADEDEVFLMSIAEVKEQDPAISRLLKEYECVFPDALPLELPPDRGSSFRIVLTPGALPKVRPMKRFSQRDLESLQAEIEGLLKGGLIKPSESEFGAQVLFVNKKDGSRRMCIDYRSLNANTVRDVYPLPLIDEIFDKLGGSRIFSKLDLRSGYHQQLLAPEDTFKTAFRTPMGNFEFLVLPFGLTNAPSGFVRMIAKTFPRGEFDKFLVPYLDDLLVHSPTKEDHLRHLEAVLRRLKEAKLYAKMSKCTFAVPEVEYLGFLVSAEGIRSDPAKVDPIVAMPPPKDVPQLRSFLGMMTYFSRFIKDFAATSLCLSALTKKGVPFVWTPECQTAFQLLKDALVRTPVLRAFDPKHEIVVQTDASEKAVGAVLLQRFPSGPLRPVAFMSRKLSPAESKYPAQEKEAAAVVFAFKKWEHYLAGAEFRLETDHQSFVHLKTSKSPSPRLVRWLDFLAEFHYIPVYRQGSTNCTADCLSRLVTAEDSPALSVISGPAADPAVLKLIREGYSEDPYFAPVHSALVLKEKLNPKFRTRAAHFYAHDGLLFFRDASGDRTAVPKLPELRRQLLCECHEAPTAGHLGVENTYSSLARRFFWPKMGSAVRAWVKGCVACQKTKPDLRGAVGMHQPLDIPSRPWESIGVDFITALPLSAGFDSIMTVIDRHSKMAHFIPTQKSVSAQGVADLFASQIFRLHGLPKSIVSDRDPKFTSDFWTALFKKLDVKLAMSTSDHPQSNGQTERANGAVVQMLRAFCYEKPQSWTEFLPLIEFAFNSAPSSSSSCSPFATVYGFQPLAPADVYTPTANSSDLAGRIKGVHT